MGLVWIITECEDTIVVKFRNEALCFSCGPAENYKHLIRSHKQFVLQDRRVNQADALKTHNNYSMLTRWRPLFCALPSFQRALSVRLSAGKNYSKMDTMILRKLCVRVSYKKLLSHVNSSFLWSNFNDNFTRRRTWFSAGIPGVSFYIYIGTKHVLDKSYG
jgi:hypothetical protein